MENKESNDKIVCNHEVLHSILPLIHSKDRVSYQEFQGMLNGNKRPSIKERVSIIHPPEISQDYKKDNNSYLANEHEIHYLDAINGRSYSGMSKKEFNQEVNRVFGFPQDVHKEKKNLASKLSETINSPKFVNNAQKVSYAVNGLIFALSSMGAVKGYDIGNKNLLTFGLTTGLLSALGLYATYKFGKASSDVSKPILD